jgi:hypothetical protein
MRTGKYWKKVGMNTNMDEYQLRDVLEEHATALIGEHEDEEGLLARHPYERTLLERLFGLARQIRAALVWVEPSERFVRKLGVRLVAKSRRRLAVQQRRLAIQRRRLAKQQRRLAVRQQRLAGRRSLQGARIWRMVGAVSLVVVWLVTIVVTIMRLIARILWSMVGLLSLLLSRRHRAAATI